jgi:ABC-type xylose transport system permease subunit
MTLTSKETPSERAADLQDERLIQHDGLRGAARAFGTRLRGGDLGSLPVVAGLILIWIIFQILNQNFLSPNNLVNLALQCASVGVIAIGIVLVLLVGEIDLSVGSVSGLAGAIVAISFLHAHIPLILGVIIALAAAALIGFIYGLLYTRFGVPSFVITLAGLLAVLGFQLQVLGPAGSVEIPFNSWLVEFTQQWFLPPWVGYLLAFVAGAAMFLTDWNRSRRRVSSGLSGGSLSVTLVKSIGLLILLSAIVWYLSKSYGVGVMFVLFILIIVYVNFALTRTKWGRFVFAVGGSEEAARRAGIKVNRIYISVFILCSVLAAVGGILAAGYGASATQSSGTNNVNLDAIASAVIGGTSFFGGRGGAYSALLGIVVIQSIASGLTLLNLNSDIQFMITGGVLLLALIIDSVSRRSRAAHGQA